MSHRLLSTVIMTSILIVTATGLVFSSDYNSSANNMEFNFIKNAFAQSANDNSSDLSSVLPDNSTDFSIPDDNATTSSPSSGTVTLSNMTQSGPSGQNMQSMPSGQTQVPGATTPEFGSIVPIILVISIISVVIVSAKAKLRL